VHEDDIHSTEARFRKTRWGAKASANHTRPGDGDALPVFVNTDNRAPQRRLQHHRRRRAFASASDIACFGDIVCFLHIMDYVKEEPASENEVRSRTTRCQHTTNSLAHCRASRDLPA
jgi:hypothetical protein